ncbi:Protein phosphatase 2C 3 [Raphanus sativus]|nr:Protein phosphatase 2C 3 [Raphanus sativus]
MSRAIGDNYLKPYVSSEPEVTVTDRTEEDEFLILASDGLWDVVTNEAACAMVHMYLNKRGGGRGRRRETQDECSDGKEDEKVVVGSSKSGKKGEIADKACTEASVLLTKLALAKHNSDNVSVVVVDLRRRRKRHVA